MLETIKYIDQKALVVIYKNYVDLPFEDREKIAANISSVENSLLLEKEKMEQEKEPVVSLSGKVIKTLPELQKEVEKPKEERDKEAINGFLENFVKTVDIEIFKKYSTTQAKKVVDIFRRICPATFFAVLDKVYIEDDYNKIVVIIDFLKETINYQK